MEPIHPQLSNIETFEIKDGEKRIVVDRGNYLFMLFGSIGCLLMPIILLLLVPSMELVRAFISTIISGLGLIFFILAFIPLYGQFLRGKCVMKITNGKLQNHKLSVPIERIQSVEIRKHPNPLKLWVYDYLVVTDVNKKKHYFNLYNMTNQKTLLLMLDVYVFNSYPLIFFVV